jgi:sugar phosphate isomerase/epimerase
MRESIHKYFQVGTIVWMSYPNRDVLDSVKTIASDDFFDAIELTQNKDPESKKKEKALLQQSHLKVCYGAQPRLLGPKLNPNAIDEAERAKAEATLIEAIDEAEYFGAKGIAFLAGKWEEATKDQAYAQLLKTTNNLCAYAATKNMNVELEVFDFDVDKAALIGPAPLAARFAGDVRMKHSNFGLLVDLSHFPITFRTAIRLSPHAARTSRTSTSAMPLQRRVSRVTATCISVSASPAEQTTPSSFWISSAS